MNLNTNPKPELTFSEIREIMQTPTEVEWAAPWTDREFQEFSQQEPLPPNQSFTLPSEEQPTEEPNQLHLNYL